MSKKNYIIYMFLLLQTDHITSMDLEDKIEDLTEELHSLSKEISLCKQQYNKYRINPVLEALAFLSGQTYNRTCNRKKRLKKQIKILENSRAQLEEQYLDAIIEKQDQDEQDKQNNIKKHNQAIKVAQAIIRNSCKLAHQKKEIPIPPYEPMLRPLEPITIHNHFEPSTYSNKNLDNIENSSDSDSLCYICMQPTEKIIPMEKICLGNHKDDFICKICLEKCVEICANRCPLCREPLKNTR